MPRICLNVLVGIPGSGKTTYCQQIVALSCRKFEAVHICYDSCIKIDTNYDTFRDTKGLYKMHRQKLLSKVEMIVKSIKEVDDAKLKEALSRWSKEYEHELNISKAATLSDVVFLIDDNNYYRSMRTEWQKIASKLSIGYFETFFDTGLSIAVQRNQQRAQSINEQVINQMWMRLEKPCGKLFHHEQNVVIIQENVDYEHVVRQIQYSFERPLECAAVQTTVSEPMEQSKVHKMDIILRQIISKKIVAAKDCMSKQEVQSFAQILQERKKRILQQMRTCELNVPEELLANVAEELL